MQQPAGERGSTLIELVMAIIIAVVALFPLLAMFSNATVRSVEPVLSTQAAFLAQGKMEEIIADYNAPARGYDYIIDANYPVTSGPPGFADFTVSVSVTGDSTYDSVQFKTVTVSVSHSGIDNITVVTWVTL